MSPEEFVAALELGHETAGVEFKAAGPRKDELLAKVIRAVLGMANRRGGGVVVLGVEENADKTLRLAGITADQAASWNYDDTSASISVYADPFVSFGRAVLTQNGLDYIVLTVDEFHELPVLCKKDYSHPKNPKDLILRRGACYVRTLNKPETIEIASQTEMRALLDLAIDKGVRAFIARAVATGVWSPIAGTRPPTDDDHFAAQIKDLK